VTLLIRPATLVFAGQFRFAITSTTEFTEATGLRG